jgi:NCAIR mutase (PurE)-related protein
LRSWLCESRSSPRRPSGASEVIFGQGKTPEQISGIARSLIGSGAEGVLITRLDKQTADALAPDLQLEYHGEARIAIIRSKPAAAQTGCVLVVSGGTSDIPVCEEAALTAEFLGSKVTRLYDVGVAVSTGFYRTCL